MHIDPSDVKSETLHCDMGAAQGAVLGPLLFSLYINDLSDVMGECDVVVFADDIVLHKSGSSLGDLERVMNSEMFKFSDYCTYTFLFVSNKKTVHMTFSPQPIHDPPIIKKGNVILKHVTSFKYLGVTIDQNLKHFSHLKMLISYMKQQVGMISCNNRFFNFQASVTYYSAYYLWLVELWHQCMGGGPSCSWSFQRIEKSPQ